MNTTDQVTWVVLAIVSWVAFMGFWYWFQKYGMGIMATRRTKKLKAKYATPQHTERWGADHPRRSDGSVAERPVPRSKSDQPANESQATPAHAPRFQSAIPNPVTVPPGQLLVDLEAGAWPESGVLSEMGYHVGRKGLSPEERREILERVFDVTLVAGRGSGATEYIRSWGPPRSRARLKKMADVIASLARNAHRRIHGDFSEAIADWESDLEWLRREHGSISRWIRWPDPAPRS